MRDQFEIMLMKTNSSQTDIHCLAFRWDIGIFAGTYDEEEGPDKNIYGMILWVVEEGSQGNFCHTLEELWSDCLLVLLGRGDTVDGC